MALPVQSIRALPEHREVLQAVADLLRQGRKREVRHLLEDVSARAVGPFRNESAALAFLRDRVVASQHPKMILFFGSRARGDAGPDSDFDLMVVLPDGLPETAHNHQAVARPLVACGLPFDVVPCAWSDFIADRDVAGSLVNQVVTEGRLLYQDRILRRDMAA